MKLYCGKCVISVGTTILLKKIGITHEISPKDDVPNFLVYNHKSRTHLRSLRKENEFKITYMLYYGNTEILSVDCPKPYENNLHSCKIHFNEEKLKEAALGCLSREKGKQYLEAKKGAESCTDEVEFFLTGFSLFGLTGLIDNDFAGVCEAIKNEEKKEKKQRKFERQIIIDRAYEKAQKDLRSDIAQALNSQISDTLKAKYLSGRGQNISRSNESNKLSETAESTKPHVVTHPLLSTIFNNYKEKYKEDPSGSIINDLNNRNGM